MDRQITLGQSYVYPNGGRFFRTLMREIRQGLDFLAFLHSIPPNVKEEHFGNTKVLMATAYAYCGLHVSGPFFSESEHVKISEAWGHNPREESQYFAEWNIGAVKEQEAEMASAFLENARARQKEQDEL